MSDAVGGQATIYALTDPDSGDIRYVGRTRSNPWKRYAEHIVNMHGSSPKVEWVRSLHRQRKVPGLKILEENIPSNEDTNRERWWVDYCHAQGHAVVNYVAPKPRKNTASITHKPTTAVVFPRVVLRCRRCHNVWTQRKGKDPKRCPHCRSTYWRHVKPSKFGPRPKPMDGEEDQA